MGMVSELLPPPGETSKRERAEALTLLTDVDDHLEYLDGVFQRIEGADRLRERLAPRLAAIRRRRQHPILSLAIVGEFSSGKSTFINALLNDDLLASSSLATTAVVTRIAYGDAFTVEPRFRDGAGEGSYDNGCLQDPRELLRRLTTDDVLARRLDAVTLRHPASFLRHGIEVLDTPGINSSRESHGATTVEALEHQADAAVVLIAADRQLTLTLADFLKGPLEPFLHRCAFVVTKMDHVRQRDRQAVISEIRDRLSDQLGLKKASIFSAAPQARIDALRGDEGREHAYWLEQFATLEVELDLHLRKARSLSLAESLIRLLRRLMADLDEHLRDLWQVYEQRAATLERNRIRDLDAFAQEIRRGHRDRIIDFEVEASAKLTENRSIRREQLRSTVRAALDRASSREQLNKAVDRWVPGILEGASAGYRQDGERSLQTLDSGLRDLLDELDRCFLAEYERLAAVDRVATLTGVVQPDTSASLQGAIALARRRQREIDQELAQSIQLRRGLKVAAGVIGLFGGPVGMVVGVGLWKLAGRFSGDLDRLREQAWEALEPRMEELCEQLEQAGTSALAERRQTMGEALESQLAEYISRYRATIGYMARAQQMQLADCRRIQAQVGEERAEIERRCDVLAARQERLRITDATPRILESL